MSKSTNYDKYVNLKYKKNVTNPFQFEVPFFTLVPAAQVDHITSIFFKGCLP